MYPLPTRVDHCLSSSRGTYTSTGSPVSDFSMNCEGRGTIGRLRAINRKPPRVPWSCEPLMRNFRPPVEKKCGHFVASGQTWCTVRKSMIAKTQDGILHVDHLFVRLGKTTVLRDVNFCIERGASLAIVGPNGAGKTVLLKALIRALPLTGTCEDGHVTCASGYVPQKLDITRDVPITRIDFIKARIALAGTSAVGISEVLSSVGTTVGDGELPDRGVIRRRVSAAVGGLCAGGRAQRAVARRADRRDR